MKTVLIWSVSAAFLLTGAALAEEPPDAPPAANMEKMQEEMRRVQEQVNQQQQENLERIKRMDPGGYEAQKKTMERQAQINQIIASYHQNSISADEAERKLTPLVKQEVQRELDGIDSQIKIAEKKLAALKQAKSNPGSLVKKRVDQLLGRSFPSPEDLAL